MNERTKLVTLPRGGYLALTPAGAIQFGTPPETIKDTMGLPSSVPRVFVLPDRTFHWRRGINLADLEFPIYFNFFIKQKKTYVCCTREQAIRVKHALQEAVFGPSDLDIEADMHPSAHLETPPIQQENAHYRHGLELADLVSFCILKEGRYAFGEVVVQKEGSEFLILHRGDEFLRVPGTVEYKPRFNIGSASKEPYRPPLFGITCLGPSHGFDPTENTSGYIIWLNHSGIMIDPPVDSTEWLEDSNVNPKFIDSIILTHCHADHDAGTFQKILEEGRITVYSTETVMQSFLRKYAALSGESIEFLRKLFTFERISIGSPLFIHGGEFLFSYRLHSIPTIGFTLTYQDKSFVYSSDHQGDPNVHNSLLKEEVITQARYEELSAFPWDADLIYHEAGIPPLHTPIAWLNSLKSEIQQKTTVYHIAKKDFPRETKLSLATFGIENTRYFETEEPAYESSYRVLDVLKHLDFFESLPIEKIQSFFTLYREDRFSAGETIIREGSAGDTFYVVVSGIVDVRNARLSSSKRLGEYEYFGEVALLTEQTRTADVVAITDVTMFALERERFLSFIAGTEFETTLRRLIDNRSEEKWNILQTSDQIRSLTNYQKNWLESYLDSVKIDGAGVLLSEGDPIEQLYIVDEGEVTVEQAGREIARLGRADFIGALHKVQRGELAEYSFRHDEGISLFRISRENAIEFVERNPGCGMKLAYEF